LARAATATAATAAAATATATTAAAAQFLSQTGKHRMCIHQLLIPEHKHNIRTRVYHAQFVARCSLPSFPHIHCVYVGVACEIEASYFAPFNRVVKPPFSVEFPRTSAFLEVPTIFSATSKRFFQFHSNQYYEQIHLLYCDRRSS
jgi:hypothetical protein